MESVEGLTAQTHILFHRPTPWDADIQCSTKVYARKFAERGYRVSYLQSPVNLLHLLLRKGYYHTYSKGSRMEGSVWVMAWMSLVPYLDRFPWLLRWSYRTAVPSLRRLLRRSGYGAPDLIWTTVPGSSVLKRLFPQARLVFHSIDSYAAYRGEGIRKVEGLDYQLADEVFVIGEALGVEIHERYGIPKEKITNLGQGVEHTLYVQPSPYPEASSDRRPKVVWVGLGRKLDRELLQRTVERMEQVGGEVLIAGPSCDWLDQLASEHEQLHLLGPIHYTRVPDLLASCDIGIMLYDRQRKEIYAAQHPLKLYEYAATGLAVISTPHSEYRFLQPPVEEVVSADDIDAAFDRILGDLPGHQGRMKEFGSRYSWDRCVDRAIARLRMHG